MQLQSYVLRGGRVIDPESGLDAEMDLAVAGGAVSAIAQGLPPGGEELDVAGAVVAPGFIDLHSHAQSLAGRRLQACDGVTCALDLEAGRVEVDAAYRASQAEGSPIHYGFSASWAAVRMGVTAGLRPAAGPSGILELLGDAAWKKPAQGSELSRILGALEDEVGAGALGIGLLMGYAQLVSPEEYLAVAGLAAGLAVPTFTHTRDLVETWPEVPFDGAEELVRAAGESGAHMHYCHVNSTSGQHVDRVLDLVERCRREGGRVTTEAYPYGRAATAIGSDFLSPDRLGAEGLVPADLTYLPTGEQIADDERLLELRHLDPGGVVVIRYLEEDDPVLRRSRQFEEAVVASDAMPLVSPAGVLDTDAWPIPEGFVTHPRSAGCFSRALRLWREEEAPLSEAIRRCTLLPALVLEDCAPAMGSKGRLREGADADIVVFDPDSVTDRATYEHSTRASAGIHHVIVAGTFVVRDGMLVEDARPGLPVKSASP